MFKRLGRFWILLILLSVGYVSNASADTTIPANAKLYLPLLQTQIDQLWPTLTQPQDLAGQIEQETCISLTWPSCWNPHTELKTSREYGFGLGQLTITKEFNNFTALQKLDDPTIKTWKYQNRYDPSMQIRALIDMDLVDFKYAKLVGLTETDQLAFMFSSYNGGEGGLIADVRYCAALPDCNHRIWFNNVETHSLKSRTTVGGVYGQQSFFSINRTYVRNILLVRSTKYIPFFHK